MKSLFREKKTLIFGGSLALILMIRLVLPGIILTKMNSYLGTFSPLYSLHIADLDLHFYRMAYSFDGVEGHLKKDRLNFLDIKKVDISLAWRELFKGRVVADVLLDSAEIKITTATIDALSGKSATVKADAKNVKEATVPFDLERVRARNSRFEFSDVAGLPPEQTLEFSGIDVLANNLTPRKTDELSFFTAIGALQRTAKVKVAGELKLNKKPSEWSINLETENFELPKINPIARRTVPLTFKTGSLTLFSAVKSEGGEIQGYVKPFLKNIVFVGNKGDFKSFKQFLVEIAGTIGNWLLKNSKTQTLATKVSFKTVKGKMEVDTSKAISLAVKNGFGRALSPSLDESLHLK